MDFIIYELNKIQILFLWIILIVKKKIEQVQKVSIKENINVELFCLRRRKTTPPQLDNWNNNNNKKNSIAICS